MTFSLFFRLGNVINVPFCFFFFISLETLSSWAWTSEFGLDDLDLKGKCEFLFFLVLGTLLTFFSLLFFSDDFPDLDFDLDYER